MLFKIIKKNNKKFPYKIKFSDGTKVPVPSQHDFPQSFIRSHGCSLSAFYMALRFCGKKKSITKCLSYMSDKHPLKGRSKYSIRQVFHAINEICPGSTTFSEKPSKAKIKKELKAGNMVLFEEKNPIHTSVLLWDGEKILRFSDGAYKKVTINQELNNRCTDQYYGGCVIVKRR